MGNIIKINDGVYEHEIRPVINCSTAVGEPVKTIFFDVEAKQEFSLVDGASLIVVFDNGSNQFGFIDDEGNTAERLRFKFEGNCIGAEGEYEIYIGNKDAAVKTPTPPFYPGQPYEFYYKNGAWYLMSSAIPEASATVSGIVNTNAQEFGGDKTFVDNVIIGAEEENADLIVHGNTSIEGNTTIGGVATLEGNTTMKGNTTIVGTTALEGNTTIGTADANGSPVKFARFTVNGSAAIIGNISIGGVATMGDNTIIGSSTTPKNLTVHGATNLKGATTVNNTLDVTGNATLSTTTIGTTKASKNLTVYGATTLNGSLTLNNGIDINSDLEVAGSITIDGSMITNGTGNIGSTDKRFVNAYFSDKIYAAGGFYETSDERLKDFSVDIDCDLDRLSKLPKKYFRWKDSDDKSLHIGTSAQAVQEIYPELVSADKTGTLSVAYDKLSVVALKGIDILNDKIKSLEERLERLEKLMEK